MSSDTRSDWALKDVAKGERDLEFPVSFPEGPLQRFLSIKERVVRVVKKLNMKIF